MKPCILAALAAVLCSCAAPRIQLPSVEPIKQAVVVAQGSTKAAQTKITEAQSATAKAQTSAKSAQMKLVSLQKELNQTKQDLLLEASIASDVDALSEELLNTQAALTESQNQLTTTQANLSTANQRADTAQQNINKAQTLIDNATRTDQKYHKLKWGVCLLAAGITAAVVGFVLFQFWTVLAGLGAIGIGIAAGAGIGLPVLVFTYLMFKL